MLDEDDIVAQQKFTSERKRATIVIRNENQPEEVRVYCKGAPEVILERSKYFVDKDGNLTDLDEALEDAPEILHDRTDVQVTQR